MKPFEFTISKNAIILTLLTLLSGVIVFDQIKIRKQEALLNYGRVDKIPEAKEPILNHEVIGDTVYFPSKKAFLESQARMLGHKTDTDSLLEANKLLKKKVDYYFEFYRKHFPPNKN